jgi:type II secretory pathway predicted ATPase ExeA
VTGEVGSGKTVAARAAMAELEPSRHTLIYLPNPAIGPGGSTRRSSGVSAALPASSSPPSSRRRPSCSAPRQQSGADGS